MTKEKAKIYDYVRLCKYYKDCTKCPLGVCGKLLCRVKPHRMDIDKTNKIILNWCKEHPVKTRQDKFLEMFPNASTYNAIINICPCKVDCDYDCKNIRGHCVEFDCGDCKKSYWLAEVEE